MRYLGKEIEDWQTALSHLTRDLDIGNIQVFHQQIPQVQHFLLQNYLENFPGLNLSKQQFEEVLNILRTKANYQHTLKKDYELVKDYQRFEIKKISRKPDLKITTPRPAPNDTQEPPFPTARPPPDRPRPALS